MYIHLTLVPYIGHAGELKTKPTQHSVNELRRIGIQPEHAAVPLGVRAEHRHPQEDRDVRVAARRRRGLRQGRRQHLQGPALVRERGRRRLHLRALRDRGAAARPVGVADGRRARRRRRRRRPHRARRQVRRARGRLQVRVGVAGARRLPARRARGDRLGRLRDAHRRGERPRPPGGRRRDPHPRRVRRPRVEGKIRAAQVAREGGVPTSASAWACRSRCASSPATSRAWTAPTRPSSTPRRRSR